MAGPEKKIPVVAESNPMKVPARVALLHPDLPAATMEDEEEHVMTVPHLVLRELVTFEVVVIILSLLALLIDAPLEGLADPHHTPNPAKAPWYFLGLQELLHYYPPVVAGVTVPLLAVLALVAIPYFRVNRMREPLWHGRVRKTLGFYTLAFLLILAGTLPFHCYPIAVPTALVYAASLFSLSVWRRKGPTTVFSSMSLAAWIMTWFVSLVVVLTVIGVFFRGPEWSWVWPWQ